MSYFMLGHRLPRWLAKPLFGDRRRWGREANRSDPMWVEWERTYLDFYSATQKGSIGDGINHGGYAVLNGVDLRQKRVLEIGPGHIRHMAYWKGKPRDYVICDIQQSMLTSSEAVLKEGGIPCTAVLLDRPDSALPFSDDEFDAVISFYSLEHIHPLRDYLLEIRRVLKPGGVLVGAIPSEGGLAWGTGRFLTSRRWLKKNTNIDPDKLICWEHPNYAEDVLSQCDEIFIRERIRYWPFRFLPLDLNLVVRFQYRNP